MSQNLSPVEFLKTKNVPETVIAEMDVTAARAAARAFGWTAPPVEATLVTYTPKSGTGKEGLYLNLAIGKSRPGMFRVCDGKELTEEGSKILAEVANQLADLIG